MHVTNAAAEPNDFGHRKTIINVREITILLRDRVVAQQVFHDT